MNQNVSVDLSSVVADTGTSVLPAGPAMVAPSSDVHTPDLSSSNGTSEAEVAVSLAGAVGARSWARWGLLSGVGASASLGIAFLLRSRLHNAKRTRSHTRAPDASRNTAYSLGTVLVSERIRISLAYVCAYVNSYAPLDASTLHIAPACTAIPSRTHHRTLIASQRSVPHDTPYPIPRALK